MSRSKSARTSPSMISSCGFRMTKSGFSCRIMSPCSIRLVAKAPHPFPGEDFNSNDTSLGTWVLRQAEKVKKAHGRATTATDLRVTFKEEEEEPLDLDTEFEEQL